MPRGFPLVGAVVADRGTLEERLWAKVQRGQPDECWAWTGATMRAGRPKMQAQGKVRPAARVIVALRDGLDLEDPSWVARHSCDYPPCVNPGHLLSGTHLENSQDSVERQRHTFRERHPMAKLTEAQVAEIRARRAAGESRAVVAAAYGIHPEHVTRVTRGRSWA